MIDILRSIVSDFTDRRSVEYNEEIIIHMFNGTPSMENVFKIEKQYRRFKPNNESGLLANIKLGADPCFTTRDKRIIALVGNNPFDHNRLLYSNDYSMFFDFMYRKNRFYIKFKNDKYLFIDENNQLSLSDERTSFDAIPFSFNNNINLKSSE